MIYFPSTALHLFITVFILAGTISLPVSAKQHIVSTPLDSVLGSLRNAVNNADTGDTVIFKISLKDTITVKNDIIIDKDLSILGTNQGTGKRIIAMARSCRIFSIHEGTVFVKDMGMSNGYSADGKGGNLYINGSSVRVTLENVLIENGSTREYGNGAGLCLDTGSLFIINSTFSNNRTSRSSGGGICNFNGEMVITGSTISNNYALAGGGLYNVKGTTSIVNSTIAHDSAIYNGGGIHNLAGRVTISGSVITGSEASQTGGGIYNNEGSLSLIECTISNDTAANGGGLYVSNGSVQITRCTFSKNISRVYEPKVYNPGNYLETYYFSTAGGGIYIKKGKVIIDKSTLSENISSCNVSTGSSIVGLDASSFGGAVFVGDGLLRISNSTLMTNISSANASTLSWSDRKTQALGGAIFIQNGRIEMINSTISSRSATSQSSGGVFNDGGRILLLNCTATGNPGDVSAESGSCYLLNSIVTNFIVYDGNSFPFIKAVNSLSSKKINSTMLNVDSSVISQKVFWVDSTNPKDNGGATQTISLGSPRSAAYHTGVHAGTYYHVDSVGGRLDTLLYAVYSDKGSWVPLESEVPVPEGTIITELTTDQRTLPRFNPPCIGSFEFLDQDPLHTKAAIGVCKTPVLSISADKLHLFCNVEGNMTIQLFSLCGQKIASYCLSGMQKIPLPAHAKGQVIFRIISGNQISSSKILW